LLAEKASFFDVPNHFFRNLPSRTKKPSFLVIPSEARDLLFPRAKKKLSFLPTSAPLHRSVT
jgi:hypothetical protein